MTSKNKFRFIAALALVALCVTLLVGCGDGAEVPNDAILSEDVDNAQGYFHGIVKSGDTYYAKLIQENFSDAPESDYSYAPLGDTINAYFRESGVEGAWNPLEYTTPEELSDAYDGGKITDGVLFTYSITNGLAKFLCESNPYENGGVDLTNGEPLA